MWRYAFAFSPQPLITQRTSSDNERHSQGLRCRREYTSVLHATSLMKGRQRRKFVRLPPLTKKNRQYNALKKRIGCSLLPYFTTKKTTSFFFFFFFFLQRAAMLGRWPPVTFRFFRTFHPSLFILGSPFFFRISLTSLHVCALFFRSCIILCTRWNLCHASLWNKDTSRKGR
jgi:hypothetical protein